MSDPDDPSSRGQKPSIQPEWDKHLKPGSNPASASTSTPGEKASSSNSNDNASKSPPQRGRRHFRDRLHRRKNRKDNNTSIPAENEKSAGSQGDAPNPTDTSDGSSALTDDDDDGYAKSNVAVRFFITAKEILFSSWINLLLIFVPVGIAVNAVGANPGLVFGINAIAIVPLAGLLSHATETVAASLGDTLGALLNVSFGNAVELIIFIIALVKDEINIVQASLIGSILSNLLLILGMAFLLGGLRFQEQIYNSTVTQMSACLLSLSVTSLLLPTAFHASFSNLQTADNAVLKVSRGTSIILLIVYVLYLLFQLKSHSYMYASMPQEKIDEEAIPGVLHDVFESSSSSDSDSSDSSSSSSSDGSHHTATRRIKRAFKHRMRRKSSGSTVENLSLKSKGTRSGSVVTADPPVPLNRAGSDGSAPTVVMDSAGGEDISKPEISGAELRQTRSLSDATVQHRDFGEGSAFAPSPPNHDNVPPVQTAGPVSRTISFEKEDDNDKHGRKSKRHKVRRDKKRKDKKEKKSKHKKVDTAEGVELSSVAALAPLGGVPEVHDTVTDATAKNNASNAISHNSTPVTPTAPRTSNRRPLVAIPAVRPQMQKMLSQTVFSSQYNAQALTQTTQPSVPRAPYGLRRASSLPDRLNMARKTVSRGAAPAHMAHTAPDSQAATIMAEEGNNKKKKRQMSRTSAVILLLVSTALVAVCAEFLVDSINYLVTESSVTEAFIGLIILPIVGNAAEHVTAVTVATKNKMDLAIGVAVGSSIQIALFVTPIVVLLGWILDKDMSLYFTLFETVSLFVSAFIVNFLVLDGRSNYLEGSLLCAAYIIIAVAAFFYPNCDASSGATCAGNDISSGS